MRTGALLLILVAGCLGGPSGNGDADLGKRFGTDEIEIKNFTFSPQDFTITQGRSVIWINLDSVDHQIVMEHGVDSGRIEPGDRFTWTFEEPGNHPYRCSIHPAMVGTVQVNESLASPWTHRP